MWPSRPMKQFLLSLFYFILRDAWYVMTGPVIRFYWLGPQSECLIKALRPLLGLFIPCWVQRKNIVDRVIFFIFPFVPFEALTLSSRPACFTTPPLFLPLQLLSRRSCHRRSLQNTPSLKPWNIECSAISHHR